MVAGNKLNSFSKIPFANLAKGILFLIKKLKLPKKH
jgi:hypothetical protein